MKVCHMTSAHGVEDVRIFHKECISLAKAGYEVYLVERGASYDKNGVHIIGVGEMPSNRLKRMTQGAKTVYRKALELDCDIYHFHDPELLPYGLKLKRKGKKVIFDSHEHTAEAILEKTWLPVWIRYPVYWIFGAYQARVCRKLDAVISVTPHVVNYFSERNCHTVQVTNYPILAPVAQEASAKTASIVFAGGISSQWNHQRIIQALERLPNCRYVLCGTSTENYLSTLKSLPAWSQVDYLGKIPHNEVGERLASCSIGVALLIPNRNSGFKLGTLGNTKIFEEMYAGLPIICTDFDLWREFVERYHCGICVDPENVDEIADAIRYLLDNLEEAQRMGENGRRAVEQEFNWGVEEKKLLELYEELVEE